MGGQLRKISPEGVRDDFRAQLADLVRFHSLGLGGFQAKADQSTFVEHCSLTAAVIWEGFVSDMFVALINRDPSRYKQYLRNSLNQHINNSGTPRRVFDKFGSIKFPDHLSKTQIQGLADQMGNNISFFNFENLEDKAETWLVEAHADKFVSLSSQNKVTVDALIALRNHIAHRSQRSLDAMNEVLQSGALHPTGLQRSQNRFHNVGAWL